MHTCHDHTAKCGRKKGRIDNAERSLTQKTQTESYDRQQQHQEMEQTPKQATERLHHCRPATAARASATGSTTLWRTGKRRPRHIAVAVGRRTQIAMLWNRRRWNRLLWNRRRRRSPADLGSCGVAQLPLEGAVVASMWLLLLSVFPCSAWGSGTRRRTSEEWRSVKTAQLRMTRRAYVGSGLSAPAIFPECAMRVAEGQ